MKNKGLTLVEILIVIVIIGTMAGIAIPAYQKSIEKGRKAEATTVLQSIWAAEKRYYIDYGTYTDSLANLDIETPAGGYYTYSITSADGDDFLAKAKKEDESYYLTINAAGQIEE